MLKFWGTSKVWYVKILRYFQWGQFQKQDSSGANNSSGVVKKWVIFGKIGKSHLVTDTGVF